MPDKKKTENDVFVAKQELSNLRQRSKVSQATKSGFVPIKVLQGVLDVFFFHKRKDVNHKCWPSLGRKEMSGQGLLFLRSNLRGGKRKDVRQGRQSVLLVGDVFPLLTFLPNIHP